MIVRHFSFFFFQFAESGSVNESTDYFGKVGGIPCHHECILDEELGLACRLCNVVCTEAKDIFPEMVGPIFQSSKYLFIIFTF